MTFLNPLNLVCADRSYIEYVNMFILFDQRRYINIVFASTYKTLRNNNVRYPMVFQTQKMVTSISCYSDRYWKLAFELFQFYHKTQFLYPKLSSLYKHWKAFFDARKQSSIILLQQKKKDWLKPTETKSIQEENCRCQTKSQWMF
jgi:hypothetical protein